MMNVKEWLGNFDYSSATKRVADYQTKLIEISKANMDLVIEHAEAISRVRSPSEYFSVTSEFTKKRIDVFQQNTKELIELARL